MRADPKTPKPTVVVADPIGDGQAIRIAAKIAQKLGKDCYVNDANGREIWVAKAKTKGRVSDARSRRRRSAS